MFNSRPATNIFTNTNNRPQQGGGLFNQNNQSNSLFSQPQTIQQPTTNLFGGAIQPGGGNSLFGGNQGSGGGNTLFGGNQTGGGNSLFGGNQGSGGGNTLFGGSQGTTSLFGQNTQSGGGYNQPNTMVGGAPTQFSQVNETQFYHLLNAPQEQQRKLFEVFAPEYIKQLIDLYRKSLDSSKIERLLQITNDNPLRGQKITKVAATLNIKPQIVQMKKLIRDNVTVKVKRLKDYKQKMENLSLDFSVKVYEKLQKYKEKLVLAVTQNKMIEEIKKEVDDLDQQIKQFFKPLFNAHQNRTNYSFLDPDPFCLAIAERLLKNVAELDNKMDQFLACESEPSDQTIQTGDVIVQLVEYYQNVAVTLKEFGEKYNRLKEKMIRRSTQANPADVLRKISEKANSIVSKDMESYDLVKEIEAVLKKRESKSQEKSNGYRF